MKLSHNLAGAVLVLSCATVAAEPHAQQQGIHVVPVDALATISQIDSKQRELADLRVDLEIAKMRDQLGKARATSSGDMAGDALIEALQRDLQGQPPIDGQAPSVAVPSAAVSPAWSVYSITGFKGDMRAVLISNQGLRMPVGIGSEIAGGGRVTAISQEGVKLRHAGESRVLPMAVAEYGGTAAPVATYTPFERQPTTFAGGGPDSVQRGQ